MSSHDLYISHSWTYETAYDSLIGMLDSKNGFHYNIHGVAKDSPVHARGVRRELHKAIALQMRHSGILILLSGVYEHYKMWIDEEIITAKELGKKILVVEPWGHERTAPEVKRSADICVEWRPTPIVKAIRDLSRPTHPGTFA